MSEFTLDRSDDPRAYVESYVARLKAQREALHDHVDGLPPTPASGPAPSDQEPAPVAVPASQWSPAPASPAASPADARELTTRIEELLQIRESLLTSLRASIEDMSAELDRVEARPYLPSEREEPPAEEAAPAEDYVVEVVVEPIAELGTLIDVERKLRGLRGVRSVFVRTYEGDRAAIEVSGPPAAELAAELERDHGIYAGHVPGDDFALTIRLAATPYAPPGWEP
jgi:hypothetical protein